MRLRFPLPLVLLSAAVSSAADPKSDPPQKAAVEASHKYLAALQQTIDLLARVTDEKSAGEAKPKLDTLHAEAREARKQMFLALAELDLPEGTLAPFFEVMGSNYRQAGDRLTAEFDRLGSAKHKAAYKVLRETKLFAGIEKQYEERAAVGASNLAGYAHAYSARNGGKVPALNDLANDSETGKKALSDPWGFPYQLTTAAGKDGKPRFHVWTVSPYTGKKLGDPPPDDK